MQHQGQCWIRGRGSEPTCAKLVGDGADEAIDLFGAEDNVVLIGDSCNSSLRSRCPVMVVVSKARADRKGYKHESLMRTQQGQARKIRTVQTQRTSPLIY